jgi:crotonobetainyl-CoA:carnitine CoA-transferase CaiB-like acyl-CoA transferase
VSDTQWALFCDAFGFDDLKADARLAKNNQRVQSRDWLMPVLRERMALFDATEIARRFEAHGLPHAPITRPHDLFDDPHLKATGGLAPVRIAAGSCGADHDIDTRVPLLPVTLDGQRLPLRHAAPGIGEHTNDVLADLGYSPAQITGLHAAGVIAAASAPVNADGSEPDNA